VHACSWKLSTVVAILSISIGGCRSLSPHAKQSSHANTLRPLVPEQPSVGPVDTTTNLPRLQPLRVYMDEIARRQSVIEARLDTISHQLETLRQLVEQRTQSGQGQPASEIVRGAKDSEPSHLDTSGTLPPGKQHRRAGVILPDADVDTPPPSKPSKVRRQQTPRRPNVASPRSIWQQRSPDEVRSRINGKVATAESGAFDTALVAIRNKQYQRARELLTTVLAQPSPKKGEYHYWRGLAAFLQQDYQAAHADAEMALTLLEKSKSALHADAMYLLAEIESNQGNGERARQLLRTILERYPRSDAAILARRKLQLLMVSQ